MNKKTYMRPTTNIAAIDMANMCMSSITLSDEEAWEEAGAKENTFDDDSDWE